jgi:hypothetical protein
MGRQGSCPQGCKAAKRTRTSWQGVPRQGTRRPLANSTTHSFLTSTTSLYACRATATSQLSLYSRPFCECTKDSGRGQLHLPSGCNSTLGRITTSSSGYGAGAGPLWRGTRRSSCPIRSVFLVRTWRRRCQNWPSWPGKRPANFVRRTTSCLTCTCAGVSQTTRSPPCCGLGHSRYSSGSAERKQHSRIPLHPLCFSRSAGERAWIWTSSSQKINGRTRCAVASYSTCRRVLPVKRHARRMRREARCSPRLP